MNLNSLICGVMIFFIMPFTALADPVGNYRVTGVNPGGDGGYGGDVEVRRTGDTYSVIWEIDNTKYYGTALGAEFVGADYVIGPASLGDTSLAVSYVSGDSFGLAYFVKQEDGRWSGIWTYGGSDKIGSEDWAPK